MDDVRDHDLFAEIENMLGISVNEDEKVRDHLFRIDQESWSSEDDLCVVQNSIIACYQVVDEKLFNQRTDVVMRVKRINECCSVSEKREAQAVDMLLSHFENVFLFQLIGQVDKYPNLFTFRDCLEAFKNFVRTAPPLMQRELHRNLDFAKNYPILPENQQVLFILRVYD